MTTRGARSRDAKEGPTTGPRAFLFDFDGTLVNSEELHRRAYNLTFLKFDLDWSWRPALYEKLLKISGGSDRIVAYIEGLNRAPAEVDRLRRLVPGIHRAKTKLYGELLSDSANRLRSGVARLFGAARQSGLKLGIAATSALSNVQTLLAAAFGNELREVVGSIVGRPPIASPSRIRQTVSPRRKRQGCAPW